MSKIKEIKFAKKREKNFIVKKEKDAFSRRIFSADAFLIKCQQQLRQRNETKKNSMNERQSHSL